MILSTEPAAGRDSHQGPASPVLVKICGLRAAEDAEAAIAAGADLLGFIFVPETPRFLNPETAGWVRSLDGAETVGVFRDAPLETILRVRDALDLDWVQLHGQEPDTYLARLGSRVLRRVPVAVERSMDEGRAVWRRVLELGSSCLPLIDPGSGDGTTCDWSSLGQGPPDTRYGLAGGLDPDNVERAIRLIRPALVDVSSGVEPRTTDPAGGRSTPGLKDHALVRRFVAAAHRAAARES